MLYLSRCTLAEKFELRIFFHLISFLAYDNSISVSCPSQYCIMYSDHKYYPVSKKTGHHSLAHKFAKC